MKPTPLQQESLLDPQQEFPVIQSIPHSVYGQQIVLFFPSQQIGLVGLSSEGQTVYPQVLQYGVPLSAQHWIEELSNWTTHCAVVALQHPPLKNPCPQQVELGTQQKSPQSMG